MIALFTQAKGHSKLGVDFWNISYFIIIAEKSDIYKEIMGRPSDPQHFLSN